MELINKMMLVKDEWQENWAEKFVLFERKGIYYVEFSEEFPKLIPWEEAKEIEPLPKPQFKSVDELENHLDVWEYSYGAKIYWFASTTNLFTAKDFLNYKDPTARATEIREINNPENRFLLRDCIVKEMRPMTDIEIIEALKEKGCHLKNLVGTISSGWAAYAKVEDYQITYDNGETYQALEVEK